MSEYKPLLILILVILAIAAAGKANAQNVCPWDADCLTWTIATKRVDGSSLAASQIASHRIETAKSATGPWTELAIVPMPATTYQRQPVAGTNYYRIVTILTTGTTSDPSNAVNSTVIEPKPDPAVLQVVENIVYNTGTFDPQAWLVKRNKAYGTIALGTECDETRPAKDGYYRVPINLVKWTNSRAKTSYPLARCEYRS